MIPYFLKKILAGDINSLNLLVYIQNIKHVVFVNIKSICCRQYSNVFSSFLLLLKMPHFSGHGENILCENLKSNL